MNSELKSRLDADMKSALKAGDKRRLGVIRLALAAIKQREVDERIDLVDDDVLAVLDKMVKQRRDSLDQYRDAGRTDLADQEAFEIEVLQDYLPTPLGDDELDSLIDEVIGATGAAGMKDMGNVMGQLRSRVQGRADMGQVSARVRARLSG